MAILRSVLVLLLAVLVLGCGTDRPSRSAERPPFDGLVLLAGTGAAESLVTWEPGGVETELPIPDPATAWLSANRRGRLLATLADGTLRTSTLLTSGDPVAWREAPSEDADLPDEPLYFATWSPSGLAAVAIATDLRQRSNLLLFDPLGDATILIPIESATTPAPPAWLDEDRVVVDIGDQASVINTQTREVVAGPGGVGLLSVSADGARAAVSAPDGRTIEVRATDAWLAGDPAVEATFGAAARVGALAMDRRGERLAAIWESMDDLPSVVALYVRDGTRWREVASQPLPGGAVRGVPGWLP